MGNPALAESRPNRFYHAKVDFGTTPLPPTLPGPPGAGNAPLVLWSTNTLMKYRIQKLYGGGLHYVWCSPFFEGAALARYAIGSTQPATSDPATIYRTLRQAVTTRDRNDTKIVSQKKILKMLAVQWEKAAKISSDQRDEIVAMVAKSDFADWRPLIYVIPCTAVSTRIQLVPINRRASSEPEYIIEDLAESEFHMIEPVPCP